MCRSVRRDCVLKRAPAPRSRASRASRDAKPPSRRGPVNRGARIWTGTARSRWRVFAANPGFEVLQDALRFAQIGTSNGTSGCRPTAGHQLPGAATKSTDVDTADPTASSTPRLERRPRIPCGLCLPLDGGVWGAPSWRRKQTRRSAGVRRRPATLSTRGCRVKGLAAWWARMAVGTSLVLGPLGGAV